MREFADGRAYADHSAMRSKLSTTLNVHLEAPQPTSVLASAYQTNFKYGRVSSKRVYLWYFSGPEMQHHAQLIAVGIWETEGLVQEKIARQIHKPIPVAGPRERVAQVEQACSGNCCVGM
eukprot:172163-Rhodomonas_salina.4